MTAAARLQLEQAMRPRRGRYPVAPVAERTIDGIVFDSSREAQRYCVLKLMQRAGKIANLECHPEFKVEIKGRRLCCYTPDFRYFSHEKYDVVVEEVKSSGTRKDPAYRIRRKAAELFYGITVTEVL